MAILGVNQSYNKINYITYGPHILITKNIDLNNIITYIEGQLDSKILSLESPGFDELEENNEKKIIFKYKEISISKKIFDSVSNINYINKLNIDNNIKSNTNFTLQINKITKTLNIIPLSSDFNKFGTIINNNYINEDGINGILYKYTNNINIFIYDYNKDNSYRGIIYKNNAIYLKFMDFIINNKEYELIRFIDNKSFFIKDNLVLFVEEKINSRLIESKKESNSYNNKYITFDIECYRDENNDFIPYACEFYTPNNYKVYLLTNYNNWLDMINDFLQDIEKVSNKHTIYIHNLSSFDSLFLLKSLYKNYTTKPLFKDNKIISINIIKFINKSKKINIYFKDSLLLLPMSLDKLIAAFDIKTKKLAFPYNFVNKDNLNYIGYIPDYVYYSENLSYKEYSELSSKYNKNNKWNLIEETKKYLHNDVKSLYEIIDKFGNEFYNIEKINITNVISISSLALNTFLTNYYDKDKTPIYIPKYKQYKDIKPAYFGGRVEVFKPQCENAYIYDAVSLYPHVMLQDMPIGKLIKSTDNNLNNYFGFCYATVEIPNNINKPILPFRDDLGNVYNPVGT
jgi:DNA polymerase type B, organellar and viral